MAPHKESNLRLLTDTLLHRRRIVDDRRIHAFAIVDLPDHVSAAAVALAVTGSGAARTKSTVLLTPEEVDQAVKKQVKYTPPGG